MGPANNSVSPQALKSPYMKKTAAILLSLLALTSCGNADKATQAADEQTATEATAKEPARSTEALYAPNGKVNTLDNATLYAPGVSVPNLTVLDFNAVWCGPCRALTPVVEALAQEYNGRVTFVSVDVDTYGDLFNAYNLGNSIPVVLILKPDGTKLTYTGTADLLPIENFRNILNANL